MRFVFTPLVSQATMAERYIPEHRRTQFKARNQFRPDELRRRREEQQVEIRKQKREENLAKRRGIQTRDGGIGVGGGMAATESDDEASAIESEVCQPMICVLHALLSVSSFLRPQTHPWSLFVFVHYTLHNSLFHRPPPRCWAKWDPPSQLKTIEGAHTTLFNSIQYSTVFLFALTNEYVANGKNYCFSSTWSSRRW